MADGRKLQERLPLAPAPIIDDMQEGEIPLIIHDYPLWMTRHYGKARAAGSDGASLAPSKTESPGAGGIFG